MGWHAEQWPGGGLSEPLRAPHGITSSSSAAAAAAAAAAAVAVAALSHHLRAASCIDVDGPALLLPPAAYGCPTTMIVDSRNRGAADGGAIGPGAMTVVGVVGIGLDAGVRHLNIVLVLSSLSSKDTSMSSMAGTMPLAPSRTPPVRWGSRSC